MLRQVIILAAVCMPAPALMADFARDIRPILEENCFDCHNAERRKGDIDLTALADRRMSAADAEIWSAALDMINTGDMPPAKKPRIAPADLRALTEWLETALQTAAEELAATRSPARIRRLNRTEYRNTVRDLIGHPFDAAELFTEDTSSHGFDNVGDVLQISPLHIDSYVAAAERIVTKILAVGDAPPARQHWRIINTAPEGQPMKQKTGDWHDGHLKKPAKAIKPGRLQGNVLPNAEIPNGSALYTMLDLSTSPPTPYAGSWDIRAFGGSNAAGAANFGFKWFAYDEGVYRVKITAECLNAPGWPHYLTVIRYPEGTEWQQIAVMPGVHTYTFEFYRDAIPWYVETSGNRHWGMDLNFSFQPQGTAFPDRATGIRIGEIEIEGPIHPAWPPAFHRNVFPERAPDQPEDVYAGLVLANFMKRAYRRPVPDNEVARMLALYRQERRTGGNLRDAMRLPLTTVLCSPDFLCISGPHSRRPATYALASRLSYFLWRSMPDQPLFDLAENGTLAAPDVLAAQVSRMLADPRSDALVSNFTQQWLGIRKIQNLQADRRLYPEYRLGLQRAMVKESEAFFRHILDNSLPISNFLDSDFAILNDELARFYRIPGVAGAEFRPVALKPEYHRGGVLGQAAVLTATGNGVRTLPVTRGAFVLERLLGQRIPSPPPNVGQLEDVKAVKENAGTREKLLQHRADPNCARCHDRIDPLGFALENFDAVGSWRDHERIELSGESSGGGVAIDAGGKLPDGRAFTNFAEFKQLLLSDRNRFVRCLTENMLVYAFDRPMNFADRRYIDTLCVAIEREGATLPILIREIVISEPFRTAGEKP